MILAIVAAIVAATVAGKHLTPVMYERMNDNTTVSHSPHKTFINKHVLRAQLNKSARPSVCTFRCMSWRPPACCFVGPGTSIIPRCW